MAGLLDGTGALIVGVANKRSIAWAIAKAMSEQGAKLVLSYQNERLEKDVRALAQTVGAHVVELDVTDDAMLTRAAAEAATHLGRIDAVVHSVAFAKEGNLSGRFVDTDRDGFALALDISAFSLTALAKACEPHMTEGGSIMTLSYIAGERAVPGYNVMGVAKAALEAMVRYLAHDLGASNIRVNAISAGPIRTLAARGIPGFLAMADEATRRSPLGRDITADDVAGAGVFLASPLSAAVTGQILYVDGGFHAVAM